MFFYYEIFLFFVMRINVTSGIKCYYKLTITRTVLPSHLAMNKAKFTQIII